VLALQVGEVVILSTDKIFLQLLSDKVVVYDHFEGKRLDAGYVQDRYGIRVDQYVDYLALVGDKSNNIKGVAGIGPKSAVELLSSYQRLDDLLATDAEDRLVSKVQAARDIALRCRQLVTLKQDVELGLNLKSFRIKG
jgi:protein Xni